MALHEVLQVTFGWSNTHLHAYRVGEFEFRVHRPGEVDSTFYIDEVAARLGAIVREGTVFTYEYDFGDDWVHDIRVDRVIPHAEVATAPALECFMTLSKRLGFGKPRVVGKSVRLVQH